MTKVEGHKRTYESGKVGKVVPHTKGGQAKTAEEKAARRRELREQKKEEEYRKRQEEYAKQAAQHKYNDYWRDLKERTPKRAEINKTATALFFSDDLKTEPPPSGTSLSWAYNRARQAWGAAFAQHDPQDGNNPYPQTDLVGKLTTHYLPDEIKEACNSADYLSEQVGEMMKLAHRSAKTKVRTVSHHETIDRLLRTPGENRVSAILEVGAREETEADWEDTSHDKEYDYDRNGEWYGYERSGGEEKDYDKLAAHIAVDTLCENDDVSPESKAQLHSLVGRLVTQRNRAYEEIDSFDYYA